MTLAAPLTARDQSPLLRWAGGKRWLGGALREVGRLVEPTSYIEPFVGGAAVFFATYWPNPVLGDVNNALIRCYRGLADDPAKVRSTLESYEVDEATYKRIASWRPRSAAGEAARLLYLNRTSYGGIYRENKAGQFNVPFSGDRTLELLLRGSRLEDAAIALSQAKLVQGDFETSLEGARGKSLIYCDPPYSLLGGERGFRRYSQLPYTWADQERLARKLGGLAANGNTVVLSNSADESIQSLYPSAQVIVTSRKSPLAKSGHVEQKEAVYVLHADDVTAAALAGRVASAVQ